MKNSKIYPWIVVGLLWGVALLNYMDRQMLSTMKDAMQIDIVELQSATNFGYLMAIFLWIYALMSPVSGVIADRMSRKWLIVGSLFVWSSVTYLMGIAETFNQIVFLRALMGGERSTLHSRRTFLDCRLPHRKISLFSRRYPHDRFVHRTSYRRIRSDCSRCFFLAHHLPLVWYYWNSLCRNPYAIFT